jgi:hypothetical protein
MVRTNMRKNQGRNDLHSGVALSAHYVRRLVSASLLFGSGIIVGCWLGSNLGIQATRAEALLQQDRSPPRLVGPATTVIKEVRTRPSHLGNDQSLDAAFSGDIGNIRLPIGFRILGEGTLGKPKTGYLYTPELTPFYTFLENRSGYNNSIVNNEGRTAAVAYRTRVFQEGQGDAVAYNASVFVTGAKEGAQSWLANPAGSIINGDMSAGSPGVYLNPGEWMLSDKGNDVSGAGWVVNLNRSNDTGALDTYWQGYSAQSIGSKSIDDAFVARGNFKVGLNLTNARLQADQSAIVLKANQRIYGNSQPAGPRLWHQIEPGGEYFTYDEVRGWVLAIQGRPSFSVTDKGVSVDGTRVLGPRVTGFTPGKGEPNFGTFDAKTAKLQDVSARVLALESALRSHGLID